MRILLVGGGGREHALAWALARHGHDLRFTHANPGFEGLGTVVGSDVRDAARGVDLVVVGPEGPLAEGIADALDVPVFGPGRDAARLETSKVWARDFSTRHGLPGPETRVVLPGEDPRLDRAWVVKLDGLAAGKGVWVPRDAAEARAAFTQARSLRPDAPILLEEVLEGPEVSVLALCDGERAVPLLPARDHKRRFDGDEGPNTGGMGAVAPVEVAELEACHAVLQRAVEGMASEGTPFRGVLYGGFMLTRDGPRLLEFNVRFGDPECQPLMMLLDEDPAPWFLGAAAGRLPGASLRWRAGVACCVVVCAEGYPERSADCVIERLPANDVDLVVFQAGTRRVDGTLRANGGRVLGVTGFGPTRSAARLRAYNGVREVRFADASWRTDIGAWTG